jgi:hypothetical protein
MRRVNSRTDEWYMAIGSLFDFSENERLKDQNENR